MSKFLFFLLCFSSARSRIEEECDETSLDSTIELFDQALNILKEDRPVIFVIGDSYAKSALFRFVAGRASELISEFDAAAGYIISYNHSDLAEMSGILIDLDKNDTMWSDFPAFDNRNIQPVQAFLTKRIVETPSTIKIALAVYYEDLRENHYPFDEVLSDTVALIENVPKFAESLSLVANMVPPLFGDVTSVKNMVAAFLNMHHTFINASEGPAELKEKKHQLIDIFLKQTKNGSVIPNDYPRISVFWKPSRPGPLDKIEEIMETYPAIRKSIFNETSYVNIKKGDISFELPDTGIDNIKKLIENAIACISNFLTNSTNEIKQSLETQFKSSVFLDVQVKLIELANKSLGIINDEDQLNILSEKFKNLTGAFGITSIDVKKLDHIKRFDEYLVALGEVIESVPAEPIDYSKYLKDISQLIERYEVEIQGKLSNAPNKTIKRISTTLNNIDRQLLKAYRQQITSIRGLHDKIDWIAVSRNCLRPIPRTLEKWIEQFKVLIHTMNITSVDMKRFGEVERQKKYFYFLKSIVTHHIDLPISLLIALSSKTYRFVNLTMEVEHNWYATLLKIYETFATYDVQKNVTLYIQTNLSDFGKDVIIDKTNFNRFIELFSIYKFEPTNSRLNELKEIVEVTLKSPPKYEIDEDKVIIKGNFVKSSDIQMIPDLSGSLRKNINVFVMDTFYVDRNLNLDGFEELKIFSHKWNIREAATFSLNGFNNSANTWPPIRDGQSGAHGHAGENAGNFFGFTSYLRNGALLTVISNGGNGGDGQDGKGSKDTITKIDQTPVTSWRYYRCPNIKKFFEKYFLQRCDAEFQSASEKPVFDIGVWAQWETIQKFRVFSSCCGTTGRGGVGKIILNHLSYSI